jgi:hypothetical protein
VIYEGDVGSPEVPSPRTALLDPGGERIEDVTAQLPLVQIGRAAYGKLSAVWGFTGCKDIPGVAFANDGGIVGACDIAGEMISAWLLRSADAYERQQEEHDRCFA